MADPASNAARRGAATTLTGTNAANANQQAAPAQQQPNVWVVSGTNANSTLLAQPGAVSFSLSIDSFLASTSIGDKSRETLRTLGAAIDVLFLANQNLMPALTEHPDKLTTRYLSAFNGKFNAICGTFSHDFHVAVVAASNELSKPGFRNVMSDRDIRRMDALAALVKNVDALGRYVDPTSTLNNPGPQWIAETRKYNGLILDAIRAFHQA